jgi:hypothetical protein
MRNKENIYGLISEVELKDKLSIKRMLASSITILLLTSMLVPTLVHPATASFDPFTSGWQYRKSITVDHTMVSAILTDFPVLVDVTDSDLQSKALSSGDDIIFMDGTGDANQLVHEVELYESGSGHLVSWVRIPSLSSTTDTTFYMYYGNGGASNSEDPEGVWSSNYKMVQHMIDDPDTSSITDSTSNNNDGSKTGANEPIEAAGKIGKAQDFDGDDDYVAVAHDTSLNFGTGDFTISAWVNYDGNNDDSDILRKGNLDPGTAPAANYKLELIDGKLSGNLQGSNPGGTGAVTTATTYDDSLWHYVVFLRQGTTLQLYVDGALQDTQTGVGIDMSNTANMGIGSKDEGTDDFINGLIDEIRISNSAQSSDWITTSFNSMNDPSSFISLGCEALIETVTQTTTDTVTQSFTDTVTQSNTVTQTETATETVYASVQMLSGDVYVAVGTTSGVIRAKPAGTSVAAWIDSTAGSALLGMAENGLFIWDTDTDYIDGDGHPNSVNIPGGSTLVASGGPIVNGPVKYYEVNRVAEGTPAYFVYEGGQYKFKRTTNNVVVAALTPTSTNDLFIIQIFTDSEGRDVIIIYGLAGRGTLAGALYFVDNADFFNGKTGYWIYEWQDSGAFGTIEHPDPPGVDTYSIVNSG